MDERSWNLSITHGFSQRTACKCFFSEIDLKTHAKKAQGGYSDIFIHT